MNIHLLPSKDYICAISLGVRLMLLSPSPLSLSEGLALAFGAQAWNLSQSAGTFLLLCGSICSAAGLADDKWHLLRGLSEQKKVVGRDKLHQGSLGLKGTLSGPFLDRVLWLHMIQQVEYVPQSMTGPSAIFCTGKEFCTVSVEFLS